MKVASPKQMLGSQCVISNHSPAFSSSGSQRGERRESVIPQQNTRIWENTVFWHAALLEVIPEMVFIRIVEVSITVPVICGHADPLHAWREHIREACWWRSQCQFSAKMETAEASLQGEPTTIEIFIRASSDIKATFKRLESGKASQRP